MSRIGLLLILCMLLGRACELGAQELAGNWFSPRVGELEASADYQNRSYFNQRTDQADADMQMTDHDLKVLLPVWQNDTDELAVTGRFKSLHLDTEALLPPTWKLNDPGTWSYEPFPDHLWDVRLGAGYRHKLDNGWIIGGQLEVGWPSDRPFNSFDDVAINANAFLRVPRGQRDAWLFFLNYANNREFWPHVPIPGVAYSWEPDDKLRALLGVPFSNLRYQPFEQLLLEASYFVPRTVSTKVSYLPVKPVRLYTGFEWSNQRFFRHDREDEDERLFYYEKRLQGGVRWDITEKIYVDVGGGFAFDRFWFEGEEYGDRGDSRINVGDGPFLAARVGITF